MRQISIDTKFKHRSDADISITRGDNRYNFTFRHNAWKNFTDTDHIGLYINENNELAFTKGHDSNALRQIKLSKSKRSDIRYCSILVKPCRDGLIKVIDDLIGDKDYHDIDLADKCKVEDLPIIAEGEKCEPVDVLRVPVVNCFQFDIRSLDEKARRFVLEGMSKTYLVDLCLELLAEVRND